MFGAGRARRGDGCSARVARRNPRTCFIEAGFTTPRFPKRRSTGTVLASSATAPATTGDATDVPESSRHPEPSAFDPMSLVATVSTSGLTRP